MSGNRSGCNAVNYTSMCRSRATARSPCALLEQSHVLRPSTMSPPRNRLLRSALHCRVNGLPVCALLYSRLPPFFFFFLVSLFAFLGHPRPPSYAYTRPAAASAQHLLRDKAEALDFLRHPSEASARHNLKTPVLLELGSSLWSLAT